MNLGVCRPCGFRKWPLLSCALCPQSLPVALPLLSLSLSAHSHLPAATLPPVMIPPHMSPSPQCRPFFLSPPSAILESSPLHHTQASRAVLKSVTSQADCCLQLSAGQPQGRGLGRIPELPSRLGEMGPLLFCSEIPAAAALRAKRTLECPGSISRKVPINPGARGRGTEGPGLQTRFGFEFRDSTETQDSD